jgi:anti-sigma B factor antagonist
VTTFELNDTDAQIAATASAPALASMVADAVATGRPRVVIDLSATDSVDPSGLSSLVASLKRCRRAGGNLRLATPSAHVTTTLQLTNLSLVLESSETVAAACALI